MSALGVSRRGAKWVARIAAAVLLALVAVPTALVSGASPRSAVSAGCGGVVSAGPSSWHHDYRAPLAIGDSTMLLALPGLSREGFSVNAHGCRQYPEALNLLRILRDAGALPRLVVIALGANGEISDGDIDEALRILGHSRLLVLVTPRELGGGAGADAQLVRAEGRRHPRRVRVLDWVAYSAGHVGWFEPDGLHLSREGSAALARLIGRVRPLAAPPRSLRLPRCASSNAASGAALAGISTAPQGGVLTLRRALSRLRVTLLNANAFAVSGVAWLEEAVAGGRRIDAHCVSIPPNGRAVLGLTLDAPALTELELLRRYRVRLVLSLSAAEDLSGTITSTYLIEQAGAP
jgi:hypothetical protein